ncbi:glycoside hydrolase family 15, partial [Cellulomonas algicola]|uniref:glycoside hydrolase family 15 n=1 Tax=Cellulomonas algicola TaxID=2071633 RepID=UPI00190F72A6
PSPLARVATATLGGVVALAVLAAHLPPAGRSAPRTAPPAAVVGPPTTWAQIPLYQETVTLLPDGTRAEVRSGTDPTFLPGSRVLDPAAATLAEAFGASSATAATSHGVPRADAAAQVQRDWLAAGTVPGAGGPYEPMARAALLDLRTLLLPGGAAVAGWSERWRYVWPRDAAFVSVALARTGHVEDALDVLAFLDGVQAADGSFQARYLPDGSGPPDDRGVQTDGTGWALWAAGLVVAELDDPTERAAAAHRLHPLVVRSTQHATALVAGTGLPPASPDYWEVPERSLTLGTVVPLVAGLQQADGLLRLTGDVALADAAARAATRSQVATIREFGGSGYARYAAGGHADAATAFLLTPFLRAPAPGAHDAWLASVPTMRRPASGLAPGAGWRDDGVSWTPQTSLYAWVAAENGEPGLAHGWLDFLDAHRTTAGSIPEKVLGDGSPAAVAPLAWSAACVLLALDALDTAASTTAPHAAPLPR